MGAIMEKFEYGIATKDGKIIAKFLHEVDRDYSMDALAEMFDDCEFNAVEVR